MPLYPQCNTYGLICSKFFEPVMKNYKKRVAELFKQLNITTILDFCTGIGGQCIQFQKHNIQSFGLDINWKLMCYALSIRPTIPFLCADAGHVPFHDSTFSGVSFVFALHDKSPQLRDKMLSEAKRLLKPGGKAIFADYTMPWNFCSCIGYIITSIIELFSGHFINGMKFLSKGGLIPFLKLNGFVEMKRSTIAWRSSMIIVAELPQRPNSCKPFK